MIPALPEFKKLELSDYQFLTEYLKDSKYKICEMAIANLYIWEDFDRPEITLINGNLCIRINPLNEPSYFLEPIGTNKIYETADICLTYAPKLSRVSCEFVHGLNKSKYNIACTRSQFDYIYETKALAELKGKKYDGKRNHIRRFYKNNPNFEFLSFQPKHQNQALELFEKWFSTKHDQRFYTRLAYTAQKSALEKAFKYYSQIGLFGGALIVEGKLMGFIIGSKLSDEMISAHFQYCDPEIQGATQIVLNEACKTIFSGYKYINLEQDLGIPGIRKAKLSYHPAIIEKKFEIKP